MKGEFYLPNGRRRCQAITKRGHQCRLAGNRGISMFNVCQTHKDQLQVKRQSTDFVEVDFRREAK